MCVNDLIQYSMEKQSYDNVTVVMVAFKNLEKLLLNRKKDQEEQIGFSNIRLNSRNSKKNSPTIISKNIKSYYNSMSKSLMRK